MQISSWYRFEDMGGREDVTRLGMTKVISKLRGRRSIRLFGISLGKIFATRKERSKSTHALPTRMPLLLTSSAHSMMSFFQQIR